MAGEKDPRRCVNAEVHAKASAVTHKKECSRLYGANAKTKFVNGTVLEVLTDITNGLRSTSLRVEWILYDTNNPRKLVKVVKLCNVRAGPAPSDPENQNVKIVLPVRPRTQLTHRQASDDTESESLGISPVTPSRTPDFIANGVEWFTKDVWSPIGGSVHKRYWHVRSPSGDYLGADCGGHRFTPYDCFMSMFPNNHLRLIVELTTAALQRIGRAGSSANEILRFFGVLILPTRFEFGSKTSLWNTTRSSKYIPAPEFGRTGMGRDRFFDILRCIRFSYQPPEQGERSSVQYRWMLVQDFVDAINKHRLAYEYPSESICVDESISRWYELGDNWIDIGLPHYVAIDRKPEKSCEIQNAACGRSGIMLRIELVTTQEEAARRMYEGEHQHGTAVLRRLVAPWAGSERVVCADSYYASVCTAETLQRMGLKFIGVIKTATTKYPMSHLSVQELSERGQHVCMIRKDENNSPSMMAVLWLDRERRYFISTTSTVLDGLPYERIRWRQTENGPQRLEPNVPQPEVVEKYYAACAQIDRHNRCRQDDLNLEKKLEAKDWSFRVNTSLLGICVVDSWLLYDGIYSDRPHLSQRTYYEVLATQLIDNRYCEWNFRPRMAPMDVAENLDELHSGVGVHLTPTKMKRKSRDGQITKYSLQMKCRVCKTKKTIHLCSACKDCDGATVWLCHTSTGRTCFISHLQKIHDCQI